MFNKEELRAELLGRDYDEVREYLDQNFIQNRISSSDGRAHIITRDLRPNRFNLVLINNIVTDITFG